MVKKAKKQRKPLVKFGAFLFALVRYLFARCFFFGIALAAVGGRYARNNKLISLGFLLFYGSFLAVTYNAIYCQDSKRILGESNMVETINLASFNGVSTAQALPNTHLYKRPSYKTHQRHKRS